MWVPGTYRDQKRVLDALELYLRMVVSYHMDAWYWTQVLFKNKKCSKLLRYFSRPRSHTFSNCDSRYHIQILMLVWLAFHWLNHRPSSIFCFVFETGSCYVASTVLFLLTQPPEGCDYRHAHFTLFVIVFLCFMNFLSFLKQTVPKSNQLVSPDNKWRDGEVMN